MALEHNMNSKLSESIPMTRRMFSQYKVISEIIIGIEALVVVVVGNEITVAVCIM